MGSANSNYYPLVLFDAQCVLCNQLLQWLVRQRCGVIFHFASLQGKIANKEIGELPLRPAALIVIDKGTQYHGAAAALHIASWLPAYQWAYKLFKNSPSWLNNFLYKIVARNRFLIWGQSSSCLLPTALLPHKLLVE